MSATLRCPLCGKVVRITRVNELRVHMMPKKKGGAGGGRCSMSGTWVTALPTAIPTKERAS